MIFINSLWCLVFILGFHAKNTISVTGDSLDSCEKDNEIQCEVPKICNTKLKLDDIEDHEIGEDNIFMIESSPKETLSSRESCALESAARNSELQVIMVRVGQLLDLQDNTTCQLYSRYKFLLFFIILSNKTVLKVPRFHHFLSY